MPQPHITSLATLASGVGHGSLTLVLPPPRMFFLLWTLFFSPSLPLGQVLHLSYNSLSATFSRSHLENYKHVPPLTLHHTTFIPCTSLCQSASVLHSCSPVHSWTSQENVPPIDSHDPSILQGVGVYRHRRRKGGT